MKEGESISFKTNHSGSVNNMVFNYNGMKFATCGNDGKINIFSTENILNSKEVLPEQSLIKNGHKKPILDLSFSHPCLGSYLASCGNDKKLIIWKEKSKNCYENIYEYNHNSPVNCCKFAPYKECLMVIAGTADGSISIHELQKNSQKWNSYVLNKVHLNGVNSLDWAPSSSPINFTEKEDEEENKNDDIFEDYISMKFISCGNDCKINIFESKENTIESFIKEESIDLKDIVPKDIAFLNSIGYTDLTFACGLENGKCLIYKNYEGEWKNTYTINIDSNIIKICWSVYGTYLGISSKNENDNEKIRFFRENMDETWVEIKNN